MMQINEKLVKYNFSKRTNPKIKYIAIHDTGNTRTGADANAHFNYFNSADRQASAHYFVDDKQILRIIKDENRSWAVGDAGGKYGITNDNSISIEMCINKDANQDIVYQKTLELTKYLMDKYNIPLKNVVRHYDASRKICPYTWSKNNWQKWYRFKDDLKNMSKEDYTEYIKNIYIKVLRREVDPEGLKYWNEKLQNGLPKGEFLYSLTESKEFKEMQI